MRPTFLMLPPQTPTTRAWAARLAAALPELDVVVAETEAEAAAAVPGADAAFGRMQEDWLAAAGGGGGGGGGRGGGGGEEWR
jgi:hypothetical protein